MQDMRQSYERGRLTREMLLPDPFAQFDSWFADVLAADDILEPNAMTLATADRNGRPSARMVLLKRCDARGFVFYTNYESRKGRELSENPWAALTFWWGSLQRQVRVEGEVVQLSAEESDAYYQSRSVGSRLGAWVSHQSQIIAERGVLEERLAMYEAKFAAGNVPRPDYWGGFCVVPTSVEFWQGGVDRLHDRFRYTRQPDQSWQIERLSP